MQFAIHFKKIELSDDTFLFKPVGIIKGEYDKKTDVFKTDFGLECDSIEYGDLTREDFFDCQTTLDELKNYFGEDLSLKQLLTKYFEIPKNHFYVGHFDYSKGTLLLNKIPLDELFDFKDNSSSKQEPKKDHFTIGFDDLKKITELDAYSIKEFLSNLIDVSEDLKAKIKSDNTNKILSFNVNPKFEKNNSKLKLEKEESKKFNLKALREEVLKTIVGQDDAVRKITLMIAKNITSKNPNNKSHLLVVGPSGTGKTEILNIIAKNLGLPIFKADATAYTKSGYVGKEVYSMLSGLIKAADGDIEKAQNGLLIVDEIDKKCFGDSNDVSGKIVLQSLLKLLDRDVVEVDLSNNKSVMFDTSNLTIAFIGSFEELYLQKKKYQKKSVGFVQKDIDKDSDIRIDEEDLIKWLGSEFEGRVELVSTRELNLQDAIKILKESNKSQIQIIKEDLAFRGINLITTSEYIKGIAEKGLSSETGVRKLNKIVKENLEPAYDEILTSDGPKKVLKLTKQTVYDPTKYYIE